MDEKIDNEFRAIFKLHIFMKRNKIPLVGIYFPIQVLNFLVFTLQLQFSPCLWKKIWKISKCFEKQLTTKYYKLSKSGEARKYFFNTRKYLFKFSITRVNLFDDPVCNAGHVFSFSIVQLCCPTSLSPRKQNKFRKSSKTL